MARALVIQSDVVGRNLIRLALERRGLTVEVAPNVTALGRTTDLNRFVAAVIGQAECGPTSAADAIAALRSRGLGCVVVMTTADPTLEIDSVEAYIDEPLVKQDVEEIADRIVEATFSGRDAVDTGWNGAIRSERKRVARELPGRVLELLGALQSARASRSPARLTEVGQLAQALASDALRFRFLAVGEVCAELRAGVERLGDGRVDPSSPAAWARLTALARLLDDPPVARVLAQHTIDEGQLHRSRGSVLVVHPDLSVLLAAAAILERQGVALVSARKLDDALRSAATRHFDAALIAEGMADGGTCTLIDTLRAAPGLAGIPIGLLASDDEHPDADARARATSIVPLPLRERAFSALLDRADTEVGRVLWLGVDGVLRRQVASALASEPLTMLVATGRDAVDAVSLHDPDLVVVDGTVSAASALAACRALREDLRLGGLPIVLLAPVDGLAGTAEACGADVVLPASFDPATLRLTIVHRLRRHRRQRDLDAASGLRSRSALLRHLEATIAATTAAGRPLSLGVVDLVGLADVSARAGADAGERLVRTVGGALGELAGDVRAVGRLSEDRIAIVAEVPAAALAARLASTCERLGRLPWIDALSTEGELLQSGVADTAPGIDAATLVAAATRAARHPAVETPQPWLRRVLARTA